MTLPIMAFIRRFDGRVWGGHLKVFDYARHIRASGLFTPALYLTPESTRFSDELVNNDMPRLEQLQDANAYFIAGIDWQSLDAAGIDATRTPVVNLIQGFTHTREPRRNFLTRPALRICVSAALRDAIAETGLANGPLVCIENATDVTIARERKAQQASVFIGGVKAPDCAREVARLLREAGITAELETEVSSRQAFLQQLRDAAVAVLLPLEHDGFFLPALEAMALGSALVIPATPGTRSYCRNEDTALVTAYNAAELAQAALRLVRDRTLRERICEGGLRQAEMHSLQREQRQTIEALRAYIKA